MLGPLYAGAENARRGPRAADGHEASLRAAAVRALSRQACVPAAERQLWIFETERSSSEDEDAAACCDRCARPSERMTQAPPARAAVVRARRAARNGHARAAAISGVCGD
jgi:hypothetical protein